MQAGAGGEWATLTGLAVVAAGQSYPQAAVFDQYLPPDATLRVVATGTSHACIDTMFGQALKDSIHALQLNNFYSCAMDRPHDPGKVDVSYPGPDFGLGAATSMDYATPSQGGEGGTCSTSSTPCLGTGDCPSGETCMPGAPSFILHYRVERLP
jgi:hypothetical protein